MRLSIEKHGVISGGSIDVSYNPTDLYFSYSGEVKINLGIATKKQKFSGSDKIDAEKMKSSNAVLGHEVSIKGHVFKVVKVGTYCATLEVSESSAKGTVEIQTHEEFIQIVGCDINASYSGVKGKIKAHI